MHCARRFGKRKLNQQLEKSRLSVGKANFHFLQFPFLVLLSTKILSNDEDEKYQELLWNLQEDDNANVIVCFCEGWTVRKLLMAIKHFNLTNRFLIIGSDGWADRQDVVSEYEMQAVGSISIRIHSPYSMSFDDYYFALDPFENHRNPWFKEFWEDKFHCKMPVERKKTTTATTTLEFSTESADNLPDFSTNENEFTTTENIPTTLTSSTTTQIPHCTGK